MYKNWRKLRNFGQTLTFRKFFIFLKNDFQRENLNWLFPMQKLLGNLKIVSLSTCQTPEKQIINIFPRVRQCVPCINFKVWPGLKSNRILLFSVFKVSVIQNDRLHFFHQGHGQHCSTFRRSGFIRCFGLSTLHVKQGSILLRKWKRDNFLNQIWNLYFFKTPCLFSSINLLLDIFWLGKRC